LPTNPASTADPIDEAWLGAAAGLATVEQLAEAVSTMDRGRQIAADPRSRLPAAVIADRQTGGRGRQGAAWWQPPGCLAVSLVVDGKPLGGAAKPTWSLACGVALAETIRELEPLVETRVRWPNDVEVSGRKLAGILVETAADGRAVFGIGVNTSGRTADAPEPLRPRVITLPDITGRIMPRQRLLAALVPRLVALLERMATEPRTLARRYRPLCSLTGRAVQVFAGDTIHAGVCRGIDDDGGLVLEADDGRTVVRSGSLTPPGGEWRGEAAGA
jgi:BirA family biotin operon repressor/biotin-[acetyl-CoA-carboxylase] ligase